MRYFLIFFICIVIIFNGNSQEFKWGVTAGLGLSEMTIPVAESMDHVMKPSYSLGVLSEIKLTNHLSTRAGLRYTRKGTEKHIQYWDGFRDVTTSQRQFKFSFVEIPVALSVDFGKDNGFILTGGIYHSLALSGKTVRMDRGDPKTEGSITFNRTFDPSETRFQTKGSDFGFIALIGYKMDHVVVDLGINSSISTVRPDNHPVDEYEWKHTIVKLNVTYFFNQLKAD